MGKTEDYYRQLLLRYVRNECSPNEVEELFDHLQSDPSGRLLLWQMQEEFRLSMSVERQPMQPWSGELLQELLQTIDKRESEMTDEQFDVSQYGASERTPVVFLRRSRRFWMAAASVLLILCASAAWFYFSGRGTANEIAKMRHGVSDSGKDAAIHNNKTTLTLADGSVIELDSAGNGAISHQGSMAVIKLSNGQLAYKPAGAVADSKPDRSAEAGNAGTPGSDGATYNTITTPRGKVYEIELADRTKVWLNAASSLRFPAAFAGGERAVELDGEAYFEVASKPSQPFKVIIASASGTPAGSNSGLPGGMQVQVLGTSFNVSAYREDNAIRTTLLAGAVKVIRGTASGILRPGEQAGVDLQANNITISEVNTDAVIAWKNGLFQFEETDIRTVMNQLARWYDVDVLYEGNGVKHFSGMISRDLPLSKALSILEVAGKIHFRTEGRKVFVRN